MNYYKRKSKRVSKIVGHIKTQARCVGFHKVMRDVEIVVYDTIRDTHENNDCVGYTQLCRLLISNGWKAKYVRTEQNKMEQRLVYGERFTTQYRAIAKARNE